jgi:hypothetical protein
VLVEQTLVALDLDDEISKIVFEGPSYAIQRHAGMQRRSRVQGCAHPVVAFPVAGAFVLRYINTCILPTLDLLNIRSGTPPREMNDADFVLMLCRTVTISLALARTGSLSGLISTKS